MTQFKIKVWKMVEGEVTLDAEDREEAMRRAKDFALNNFWKPISQEIKQVEVDLRQASGI